MEVLIKFDGISVEVDLTGVSIASRNSYFRPGSYTTLCKICGFPSRKNINSSEIGSLTTIGSSIIRRQ